MIPARLAPTLIALLLSTQAALAACDLPSIGPTDIAPDPQGDGTARHVVAGIIGICDPTLRSFDVDLPDLHGIRTAVVQLSLSGFSRKYGVHQIGFVLQSLRAIPTAKGVTVQYGATIDGLDRYQLAYTLYIGATR